MREDGDGQGRMDLSAIVGLLTDLVLAADLDHEHAAFPWRQIATICSWVKLLVRIVPSPFSAGDRGPPLYGIAGGSGSGTGPARTVDWILKR